MNAKPKRLHMQSIDLQLCNIPDQVGFLCCDSYVAEKANPRNRVRSF